MTLVLKVDDLGTVPSTVPMSSMSKPAPLDPAQFSLSRHGHSVQNGGIFFVSMSLGASEFGVRKEPEEVEALFCVSENFLQKQLDSDISQII